jgi:nicotinamide riboside transporter PnuC
MVVHRIFELIMKIGVVFDGGAAFPKWFDWRDKRINVKEVTYTWLTSDGWASIVHFSVIGDQGYYELAFDKRGTWMLEKMEARART